MADSSLAMQPRGAAPAVGNSTSVGRSAGGASSRPSDGAFARSFGTTQQAQAPQAASNAQAIATQAFTRPSGPGLLSTGVQFLLAETRTQEAAAAFPAPSNLERARDAYQRVQKRVRETINATVLGSDPLAYAGAGAAESARASEGHAAYAAAASSYEDSGHLDDDLTGD